MITGANAGIGFVTARTLLEAGAEVIITTRSEIKTTETINRLVEGLPLSASPRVKGVQMDLSSFSSIRDASQDILKFRIERLDAICLNAGVLGISEFTETEDGLEMHWGVNHVGHFYFLKLLMPTLMEIPGHTRIVVVASAAHSFIPRNFTVSTHLPPTSENYNKHQAYSISKMCNILMARQIEELFGHKGITAYSVHPGVIFGTGLYRSFCRCLAPLLNCCGYMHCLCLWHADHKTVRVGASTQLFVMTEPLENLHGGGYYAGCRFQTQTSPQYKWRIIEDPKEAEDLWTLTEQTVIQRSNSL